jgi:membrane protein
LTALPQRVLRVLDPFPPLRRLLSELSRIELIDRSLALGAQALLALIPMLMVLGAFMPEAWVQGVVQQIRDVVGLNEDVMQPLREVAQAEDGYQAETGIAGLVVSFLSASSFSRALQRMYARAWELPNDRGVRALRSSLLWILGWLLMLQVTALLLRSMAGVPNSGLLRSVVQLAANTLLWWWTSRLLLGARVPWRNLLPGAVVTAASMLALTSLSGVFMPAFTRSNLDQFGPLGVVFAVGSWLVVFGGVLVVATVVGRLVSQWWLPSAVEPDGTVVGGRGGRGVPATGDSSLATTGDSSLVARLPGRDPAGEEESRQGDQGEDEQRGPKAG